MDNDDHRYWFPAKRYGYGWGFPVTWQGWALLFAWTAILIMGLYWLPSLSMVVYCIFPIVMLGVLITTVYVKGEPPRWRWGDKT